MKQLFSLLLGILAGFLVGWYSRGRQIPDAGEVVVRVDTIYYERPQFTARSSRTVTVNVPRMLFAPAPVVAENATTDGSCSEIPDNSPPTPGPGTSGAPSSGLGSSSSFAPADSVQMRVEVEVETRIYDDSLYRAQVSGPAVGELHPSLDWIELYAHTTTQTRTRRQRLAFTAGVGAAYTPQGFQPTVGVQVGVVLWGF